MISWLRRRDQLLFVSTVRDTVRRLWTWNHWIFIITRHRDILQPRSWRQNQILTYVTWCFILKPDQTSVQCCHSVKLRIQPEENVKFQHCWRLFWCFISKQKCISLSQHKQLHVQKITKNNVLNPTKGHETADETSLSSLCCVQVETSWTLDWYSTSE